MPLGAGLGLASLAPSNPKELSSIVGAGIDAITDPHPGASAPGPSSHVRSSVPFGREEQSLTHTCQRPRGTLSPMNDLSPRPRTVYYVAQSLDGYIATADHGLDWLLAFDGAEGIKEHYEAFVAGVGAIVMGASTYDFLLRQEGSPWPYTQPTWVLANRTRPIPPGADVRFAKGPVNAPLEAAREAAAGKNVWLVGGGDLAAQAARAGLLDELHLGIAPVVLGGGIPLLPARLEAPLTLLGTTTFGRGFVELRYAVSSAASACSTRPST